MNLNEFQALVLLVSVFVGILALYAIIDRVCECIEDSRCDPLPDDVVRETLREMLESGELEDILGDPQTPGVWPEANPGPLKEFDSAPQGFFVPQGKN